MLYSIALLALCEKRGIAATIFICGTKAGGYPGIQLLGSLLHAGLDDENVSISLTVLILW